MSIRKIVNIILLYLSTLYGWGQTDSDYGLLIRSHRNGDLSGIPIDDDMIRTAAIEIEGYINQGTSNQIEAFDHIGYTIDNFRTGPSFMYDFIRLPVSFITQDLTILVKTYDLAAGCGARKNVKLFPDIEYDYVNNTPGEKK